LPFLPTINKLDILSVAKRVFLTQPVVLWKVYSSFTVERGKILGMHIGIFSRCPDFCWDLAMRIPEETFMSSRNVMENSR